MKQRIFCGTYSGAVGLKTALPGFDVTDTAGDDDRNKRSFNSKWVNFAKVAIIGKSFASSGGNAVVHGLGYIPYYELRVWSASGNTYYDDYCATIVGSTYGNVLFANSTYVDAMTMTLRSVGTYPVSYLLWAVPVQP